jgi:hypothetical protein
VSIWTGWLERYGFLPGRDGVVEFLYPHEKMRFFFFTGTWEGHTEMIVGDA